MSGVLHRRTYLHLGVLFQRKADVKCNFKSVSLYQFACLFIYLFIHLMGKNVIKKHGVILHALPRHLQARSSQWAVWLLSSISSFICLVKSFGWVRYYYSAACCSLWSGQCSAVAHETSIKKPLFSPALCCCPGPTSDLSQDLCWIWNSNAALVASLKLHLHFYYRPVASWGWARSVLSMPPCLRI